MWSCQHTLRHQASTELRTCLRVSSHQRTRAGSSCVIKPLPFSLLFTSSGVATRAVMNHLDVPRLATHVVKFLVVSTASRERAKNRRNERSSEEKKESAAMTRCWNIWRGWTEPAGKKGAPRRKRSRQWKAQRRPGTRILGFCRWWTAEESRPRCVAELRRHGKPLGIWAVSKRKFLRKDCQRSGWMCVRRSSRKMRTAQPTTGKMFLEFWRVLTSAALTSRRWKKCRKGLPCPRPLAVRFWNLSSEKRRSSTDAKEQERKPEGGEERVQAVTFSLNNNQREDDLSQDIPTSNGVDTGWLTRGDWSSIEV